MELEATTPNLSSIKSYFRLEDGKVLPCEFDQAQIVCYNMPGPTELAEMQELYDIDFHTLQSALDPDELSRLEFETNHAAIIFKRPKSYCADDNFLLRVTSTGLFLYPELLVVVMSDDAPLFEGRVPFAMENLHYVVLRLLYQSIFHFEGHLKAINMLSDSIEKRLHTSMENKYLLHMFALEKSLVYILNSLSGNTALVEKMKTSATKLDFDRDEMDILDDIAIENHQCFRRADIYAQVIGSLMDARASIINNNMNQLMKKFTIIMLAVMLPTMVTAVFSMNVKLPIPMQEASWPFWFVIILSAAPTLLILWLWRVKKW